MSECPHVWRHLRTEQKQDTPYNGRGLLKETEVFYCMYCRTIVRDVTFEKDKA